MFGERLKLWRDTKLSGADFFDDLVAHRLSITNIFVAVITPAYIKSEWCMRELTEFYRQAQKEDEVVVGGQSRIVKVVKTPTEYEGFGQSEVHQLLASIPSFQFYEIRADGRPREFTPDTSRGDQRFWQRLDDLAYDIVELLKKQRRAAEGVPLRDESPAGADVYLAETGFDLDFQRDGIRQELQQRGYQVVPHGKLPREVNALREVVSAHLERCRLSVHLIGDSYGPILEGDNRSTVETQNELAAERSERAGFSRVIWMPVGLNPHDVRQQQFVEGLRRDVHAQRGADLLESSLESLKTFLHEKLTSRPGNVSRMVRGKTIRIYVIFDQRDLENVKRIEDYLFGLGFEVIIPPFEGDGAEIAQLHRENLMLCDAVLIYYGQGSDLWLRSKLTDLRKALGWGRAEPMLAQAVVIGPPETAEKRNFRSHESIVILDFGDFTPKSLQPLVEAIQAKS